VKEESSSAVMEVGYEIGRERDILRSSVSCIADHYIRLKISKRLSMIRLT